METRTSARQILPATIKKAKQIIAAWEADKLSSSLHNIKVYRWAKRIMLDTKI